MHTMDIDRRTVLKATGASLAAVAIAGCSGSGDDDDDVGGNGGDDTDGNGADDSYEVDPSESILLEGITGGYVGIEPSSIEGVENPTLVLQDGEEYEIGWTQGDGASHNVELWDSSQNMVDDYGTTLTNDPGDGDYLTFTATDEIAYYRCQPHPDMQGEIQVE